MHPQLAKARFLQYRQTGLCFTAYPALNTPTGFIFYLRRLDAATPSASIRVKVDRADLGDLLLARSRPCQFADATGKMSFKQEPEGNGILVVASDVQGEKHMFRLNYGQSENLLAFVETDLRRIFGWEKQPDRTGVDGESASLYV